MAVVPDVGGETLATATIDLGNANLVVGAVTGGLTPTSTVCDQTPAPNTQVGDGSSVDLKMTVEVPNIVNKTYNDAVTALQTVGLDVGNVTGSAKANANVIGQNPAAGPLCPGSTVDLDLKVVVPDVLHQTLQAATQTLTADGLQLGAVTGTVGAGAVVTDQNPASDSQVMPNSAIDLTVTVPAGFDSAKFVNCRPDGHVVNVHALDITSGTWQPVGGGLISARDANGNCPGAIAPSVQFHLTHTHVYSFVAVDPWLPNCLVPDPTDPHCVCWQSSAIQGVAGGGTTDQTIT